MAKHASVPAYLDAIAPELRPIATSLCALVRATVPDAAEAIKWSMPTWSQNGPFVYVKAFTRHVNLGFWRGASLPDPAGLVQTTGDKMGHVPFRAETSIDAAALAALILHARELNERLGDPSRTR